MASSKTGKSPKKNMIIKASEETQEQLELLSRRRRRSISALVSEFAAQEVKKLQEEDERPRRKGKKDQKDLSEGNMVIPKYDVDEVEITLLTVEEAKALPRAILRTYSDDWWLRTPGDKEDTIAAVAGNGFVLERGLCVNWERIAVRPAFIIANLKSSKFDKILVGNTWCTVVAPGLALADKKVCWHRYDAKSNNWETSELKAFIKSDEFKAKLREKKRLKTPIYY